MTDIPIWIFLAFLSPILLGINMVVNKIMLTKYIPDAVAYLILVLLTNILFVVPASMVERTPTNAIWVVASMVLGMVFGLSHLFSNKVLQIEEASSVSVLTRLQPLFVVLLSMILLGEKLSVFTYVGILLLAAGGLVVSLKEISWKNLRQSRVLMLITIFNLVTALALVSRKYVLGFADYWVYFYWAQVGSLFGGLVLLAPKDNRQTFSGYLRSIGSKAYMLRLLTFGTYLLAAMFTVIAVKQGSVSVVSGIFSIQPLIVLIYAALLTRFYPNVLKEEQSKSTMLQKLTAVVLVIVGSWLVIVGQAG